MKDEGEEEEKKNQTDYLKCVLKQNRKHTFERNQKLIASTLNAFFSLVDSTVSLKSAKCLIFSHKVVIEVGYQNCFICGGIFFCFASLEG